MNSEVLAETGLSGIHVLGRCTGAKLIHHGKKHILYRATPAHGEGTVVLKTLVNKNPQDIEIERLRLEYDLLKHCDIGGVVKPLGLEQDGRIAVLSMVDAGSQTLHDVTAQGPLATLEFLAHAKTIASIVS